MSATISLTKTDIRRALVTHHFVPMTLNGAFDRLRSVQYDPLSPAGCNHDLVLQARVKNYRIGDWQKLAYKKRVIYDGWDKMASLVPFDGWPLRRVFHQWHLGWSQEVRAEHPEAIDAILGEIRERGPMCPRDFEFQAHREDWKGTWYGPSVTKQTLRALWHAGEIMTHTRRAGQHVYDLTERIVPTRLLSQPIPTEDDFIRGIILERARAMGFLPVVSPYEIWSMPPKKVSAGRRNSILEALVEEGELKEIDLDGMKAVALPSFLETLGEGRVRREVRFIAPLDQFMWHRNMIRHVFGFDYVWEVYVPQPKRLWGYYVLPVLFGDRLIARFDVWSRAGVLQIRSWHWESGRIPAAFWPAFESALAKFLNYAGATSVECDDSVDTRIQEATRAVVGD